MITNPEDTAPATSDAFPETTATCLHCGLGIYNSALGWFHSGTGDGLCASLKTHAAPATSPSTAVASDAGYDPDSFVENYIRSLPWSDNVEDEKKTLVAGNIRRFSVVYRNHLADPEVKQ